MTQAEHYSVLLKESVSELITNRSGLYVDGTFGRGGHSREILAALTADAQLVAFDKDPEAVAVGKQLEREDSRFTMIHGSFTEVSTVRDRAVGGKLIDGVILDLGVSSPQLDKGDRGFSFIHDGPLDMRMNTEQGITAEAWINNAAEAEIAKVLREYGEEKFAKRMARAVVRESERERIETTHRLASIISEANPRWEKGKHPATRAFQAIRIFINGELDDLEQFLDSSLGVLKGGGRLVVISFHSLEDRIVKRFFRNAANGRAFPKNVPVTEDMLDKKLKIIGKAVRASDKELGDNIRSRSAVMRVAERLN